MIELVEMKDMHYIITSLDKWNERTKKHTERIKELEKKIKIIEEKLTKS